MRGKGLLTLFMAAVLSSGCGAVKKLSEINNRQEGAFNKAAADYLRQNHGMTIIGIVQHHGGNLWGRNCAIYRAVDAKADTCFVFCEEEGRGLHYYRLRYPSTQ